MMRYLKQKKMNRYERRAFQQEKLMRDIHGEGVYLYRNNLNADLRLPKDPLRGPRTVGPHQEFEGDNYFFGMLKTHELVLIREIQAPTPQGGSMPDRLILDQPDTITHAGKVEHTVPVAPSARILPESKVPVAAPEVLLIEDPLDGVDILTD